MMAKKVESRKPLPKMPSKGKSKKAEPVKEVVKEEAPPAEPKEHARKPKKGEEDRLAKGRRLATAYLVQRDGLDEETAKMVIEGLDADGINELMFEANTATIEKTNKSIAKEQAASPATTPQNNLVPNGEIDEVENGDIPDFMTIPQLADSEDFALLVLEAASEAQRKNDAEKKYKAAKARLIPLLKAAGVKKVEAFEHKLSMYTGHNVSISQTKLLENGVSIDIINKCKVDTPYDDVKITAPKVNP